MPHRKLPPPPPLTEAVRCEPKATGPRGSPGFRYAIPRWRRSIQQIQDQAGAPPICPAAPLHSVDYITGDRGALVQKPRCVSVQLL